MVWLAAIVTVLILIELGFRTYSRKLRSFRAEDWVGVIVDDGNHSGRPKGLRWIGCRPTGESTAAPDGQTLFVGYEVRFEIIPGSDMEGIDAATIPRPVTIVFERTGRTWRITRPPIFNLSPGDVRDRSG